MIVLLLLVIVCVVLLAGPNFDFAIAKNLWAKVKAMVVKNNKPKP